jgi:hypothetical protein
MSLIEEETADHFTVKETMFPSIQLVLVKY